MVTDSEYERVCKELSDTKGLLATARENLVAIDAQRAKAVREMEEVAKIADECVATAKSNDGISVMEWMMRTAIAEKKSKEAQAQLAAAVRERDELQARLDEINSLGHATAKGAMDMLMNRTHQLNAARDELAELRRALADAERERDEAEEKATRFLSERFTAKANLHNLQSVYRDSEKECDALRKELSDTQGLLATARENLVAIDAQRADAVREMDESEHIMHEAIAASYKIKALLVRCVNEGTDGGADDDVSLEFLNHVPAECAAIKQERDALRAQVAELRAAIFSIGALTVAGDYLESDSLKLSFATVREWNALVARLRAAAKEEVGQ